MGETRKPSIFWEIHSGLPREGPGDNESTRRAYFMASGLPASPRILDVGCGPGMQTIELARISGGTVVALDTHRPFLDELDRRAAATGFEARIRTVCASMFKMPFEAGEFDLLWSEGALYFMGFERGITEWRRFLAPDGYLCVTEPCWLKADPPDVLRAHWAEYPGMTSVEETGARIARAGYEEIGHFTIPLSAWWDDYYGPKRKRLAVLREKYRDDAGALAEVGESETEIAVHAKYADLGYYGYVFFTMRRGRTALGVDPAGSALPEQPDREPV